PIPPPPPPPPLPYTTLFRSAFSFNMANAIFGGTAPFMATLLIDVTGSSLAPAWYLVAAAIVTLVAMVISAETAGRPLQQDHTLADRKSTRLNSSHVSISYAV